MGGAKVTYLRKAQSLAADLHRRCSTHAIKAALLCCGHCKMACDSASVLRLHEAHVRSCRLRSGCLLFTPLERHMAQISSRQRDSTAHMSTLFMHAGLAARTRVLPSPTSQS